MSFVDTIFIPFSHSVKEYGERHAFCIKGEYYTYNDRYSRVRAIRQSIAGRGENEAIGLVPNDDIDTYASIFAIWLEGKHYVPLHPSWPIDRCKDIIAQVEIDCILDSSKETRFEGNVISTPQLDVPSEGFD